MNEKTIKYIVALFGSENTGKTLCLKSLARLLKPLANSFNESVCPDCGYDNHYAFEYNGKRIAITTDGDIKNAVRGNIAYAKENDCDILITATRTRGETCAPVYKEKTQTKWVAKYLAICDNVEEEVNQFQAEMIKKFIDTIIQTWKE